MDKVEEILAEVKRLQNERKEISKKILSLMNQVRYIRTRGEPKHEVTDAEKMFGKRLRDMTKTEAREYYRIKTQQCRAKRKGGNDNE